MTDSKRVRCRDCGLACVRYHGKNEFIEIDDYFRANGRFEVLQQNNCLVGGIICFASEHDLRSEFKQNRVENESDIFAQNLASLETERECGKFLKRVQGFSPKELSERRDMDIERERRERFEERLVNSENRTAYWAAAIGVLGTVIGTIAGWLMAILSAVINSK